MNAEKARGLEDKLKLISSNFGRLDGWHVEHNGNAVAELVDPIWQDMFWERYTLIPVEGHGNIHPDALEKQNWEECRFAFRNRVVPSIVVHDAFGTFYLQTREVALRALHFEPLLSPFERLLHVRAIRRAFAQARKRTEQLERRNQALNPTISHSRQRNDSSRQ